MKRLVVLATIAVLVLFTAALPRERAAATNPGTPGPLLTCADVTGNGVAGLDDIFGVASRFGSSYPSLTYHPLFDMSDGNGSIGIGDVLVTASDFGLNCQALTPVNTQIVQATLAILNDPEASLLLNCNEAELAERGYLRGSTDVPGQGIHYVNAAYWDGVFNPAQPEGLVCNDGRLAAQLYYSDGDVVGWGPVNPAPEDQVHIDTFCSPQPCSWAGAEDGWHWHKWLCTLAIGTPFAAAIPGELVPALLPGHDVVDSEADCAALALEFGLTCTFGVNCAWDEDSGWMGHLWNHQVNPNGRFADCHPDGSNWKAFNCPQ